MKTRIAIVAALLVLAPLCAFAQKVDTDFDPKADFTVIKTYAWSKGTPAPNPLAETRIHEAVDQQLQAKGWKCATANPDVFVVTHVVMKEQKELNAEGFRGGWRFGGGMGTASVSSYFEGTLAVDLYSAADQGAHLARRGYGHCERQG